MRDRTKKVLIRIFIGLSFLIHLFIWGLGVNVIAKRLSEYFPWRPSSTIVIESRLEE